MISKKVENEETPIQFHETFPFGLSWTEKKGKQKLEYKAYFPYDDYRDKYSKRLKTLGSTNIKKFKTKPR